MKIGVIGAGGVGGYFAAALAASGAEVHLLATARHVEPVAEHGLRVTEGDGSPGFTARPASVTTDPVQIGVCDAVIVACKADVVQQAVSSAAAMIGEHTAVLPLQNGVSASAQITAAVGEGHALGGVCIIISYLVEPGVIHHVGGRPAVILGELHGDETPRVRSLAEVLHRAGITATISASILTDMWRKFMLITSYGGVGALSGESVGRVRGNELSRSLIRDAMLEVAVLARAVGAELGEEDVERGMSQVDAFAPESTASMQRDLLAGRHSEIEEQSGAVVRIAREYGVQVPIHHTIYRALKLRDGAGPLVRG